MNYYVLLIASFLIIGCAPKAMFIQGGEKAAAHIEITATGGRIDLQGPFVYCTDSRPKKVTGKGSRDTLLKNCPIVAEEE